MMTNLHDAPARCCQTRHDAMSLTPLQGQVLRGLIAAGGTLAYRQVFRAATGMRWSDLGGPDRLRVGLSMRGLERRRMLIVSRQWDGALAYGQPGVVRVTELGRSTVTVP
jgi:hypothetical protein